MNFGITNNFSGSNNIGNLQEKVNNCQSKVQTDSQTVTEKSNLLSTLNSDKAELSNNLSEKASLVSTAQSVLDTANSLLSSAQSIPIQQIKDEDGNVTQDSSLRDAAINQAKAAINSATAELNAAEKEYEQAQKAVEQKEKEASQAQTELNNANTIKTNDEAALSSAQQELSAAQMQNNNKPNGEIDNPFYQNDIGDCGLLSSIYAMSCSEKGAEHIKNSIKSSKDKDGKNIYNITFSGINETYSVSQDEIDKAQNDKNGRKYATGDNDVTLIELAVEKCITNSNDNLIRDLYPKKNDNENSFGASKGTDYLRGISANLIDYIFTGNTGGRNKFEKKDFENVIQTSSTIFSDKELNIQDIDGKDVTIKKNKVYDIVSRNDDGTIDIKTPKKFLQASKTYTIDPMQLYDADYNNFKSNNDDFASHIIDNYEQDKNSKSLVWANMEDYESDEDFYSKVKDVNGNEIELAKQHAYAVSNVEGDVITLVNPWNTGEEMKFNKEELFDLDNYQLYDLTM